MSSHQFTRPEGTGGKSILGSDDKTPLNQLEKKALGNLDQDKLNELAKCLFTLNNRRYGPIPGAYMVMCTKPGKEWCVAQLNADRAKPFIIFEDKAFSSIEEAQNEAERIKIYQAANQVMIDNAITLFITDFVGFQPISKNVSNSDTISTQQQYGTMGRNLSFREMAVN